MLRCIYESILQTTFVILAFLDEKVLFLSHLLLPSKNSGVNTLAAPWLTSSKENNFQVARSSKTSIDELYNDGARVNDSPISRDDIGINRDRESIYIDFAK